MSILFLVAILKESHMSNSDLSFETALFVALPEMLSARLEVGCLKTRISESCLNFTSYFSMRSPKLDEFFSISPVCRRHFVPMLFCVLLKCSAIYYTTQLPGQTSQRLMMCLSASKSVLAPCEALPKTLAARSLRNA